MESVKFYFHKRKPVSDSELPIYPIRLHFHYAGTIFRYSTGLKWQDEPRPIETKKNKKLYRYWDLDACRPVIGGKSSIHTSEAEHLYDQLESLEKGIKKAYKRYRYDVFNNPDLKLPAEPTPEALKAYFLKEMGISEPVKEVQSRIPTIQELRDDFLSTYNRRSIRMFNNAFLAVGKFVKTPETFTLDKINREWVEKFKEFLFRPEGMDLVNLSANDYLVKIRTAFKELFGIGKKNIGVDKYKNLNLDLSWLDFDMLPTLKKSVKFYLTERELHLLRHTKFYNIGTLRPCQVAAVIELPGTPVGEVVFQENRSYREAVDFYLFAIDTPLRISDITKLDDTNLTEVRIRNKQSLPAVQVLQTKTQDQRVMVLSEANVKMIDRYRSQKNGLLTRKTHRTININLKKALSLCPFLQYEVKYYAMKGYGVIHEKMPKWKAISFHTSLNTFTTLGLQAGVPLTHIQGARGHANPATTLKYDMSTQEDIAHSIRQFQNRSADFDL